MVQLNIKPLSVNEAFYGKKIRTSKHRLYEKNILFLLPKITIGNPPFKLFIEFGFSSKSSDIDNPIKVFQDCLVKKYDFDDRDIYELHAKKIITKKGEEFIKFRIDELTI